GPQPRLGRWAPAVPARTLPGRSLLGTWGDARVRARSRACGEGGRRMASYAEQVGERLRNIRLQKGLSLHDVEERSGKEFKASVLGAYERGERSISVPRLQRLAILFRVPVHHLLPRLGPEAAPEAAAVGTADETL